MGHRHIRSVAAHCFAVTATILAVVFSTSTAAIAEPIATEITADSRTNDEASSAPGAIVSEIRVNGNRAISAERVVAILQTAVGQPFNAAVMGTDTKKLMQAGLFNSVKMRREPHPDGTVLVLVDVNEGKLLRALKIEGGTESEKLLMKKSGLKVGEPFDPDAVKRAQYRLEQYLHSEGLADAKVTILEGDQPDDRSVRLHVEEGEWRGSGFAFGMSATRRNAVPIKMRFTGGSTKTRSKSIRRRSSTITAA